MDLGIWIFLAHPPEKIGGSGFTFQVLAPEKRRCGLSSPIPCAPAPCPSPGLLINLSFHPPHSPNGLPDRNGRGRNMPAVGAAHGNSHPQKIPPNCSTSSPPTSISSPSTSTNSPSTSTSSPPTSTSSPPTSTSSPPTSISSPPTSISSPPTSISSPPSSISSPPTSISSPPSSISSPL